MRIGVVVDNEFVNDVRVRKEVDSLLRLGYQVSVLCLSFRKNRIPNEYIGLIDQIRINRKLKNVLYFLFNTIPIYECLLSYHISKFILDRGIEILHVHDLYLARAGRKAIHKSKMEVSLILDLHENYPAAIKTYNWTKGRIRNLLARPSIWQTKEGKYLSMADKIVVLSNYYKTYLVAKYGFIKNEDVFVYENTIDFDRFDQFSISSTSPPVPNNACLYFGVVAERRGVFEFIENILDLRSKDVDICALIIGPVDNADRERFESLQNHQMFKEGVKYIPWIDVSDLLSYMDQSIICVAPFHKNDQHDSGVANKIFQYMYGKKPIIASDCIPQKELIEDADCGFVFHNANELRDSLIRSVENPDEMKEKGLNGFKYLHRKYSIKKMDSKLASLYESI